MSKHPDDWADKWYFDLGEMAKRIEANEAEAKRIRLAGERRAAKLRQRQWVVISFVLFAFFLLAYRSEVNADRIEMNGDKISETQDASCLSGLVILAKFNTLQGELVAIERSRTDDFDPLLRDRRIAAYEQARILPLPQCDGGKSNR